MSTEPIPFPANIFKEIFSANKEGKGTVYVSNQGLSKITFEEVFFVGDETAVKVGTPLVAGAKVTGTIVAQGRHDKVWGIKHKAKKRYKVKFGHKQTYTEVLIEKIA